MHIKSNYYRILLSIVINNFGDVLFDLFIVWRITNETESIMSAVYMIGSSILFRAVLSMFIGVIVDRFNKKKMIILSNFSSACIILAFAFLFDFIKANIIIGVFFILLNDVNNEVFGRCTLLISSELFDKETFIKFQAKYSIINRIVIIAGSSIVGVLISIIPSLVIFMLDIVTFVISAVLIALVSYHQASDISSKTSIKGELLRLKNDISYMLNEVKTNKFIILFMIIMFVLNLAYGFIPYILPVKIANEHTSATLLGIIKSSIAIGEVIGLFLVSLHGEKVSLLFKISMVGNAIVMGLLCYADSIIIVIGCFLMYGLLDSITQPLFGYTVSMIDEKNRGKILGGIDAIILLSPSIGMYIITRIMDWCENAGYLSIICIFGFAFLIVKCNKELNCIDLKGN